MRENICIVLFVAASVFFSCTTPKPETELAAQTAPVVTFQEIENDSSNLQQPEPPAETVKQTEYDRAVGSVETGSITQADFESDRQAVMATIAELDLTMKTQDYQKWLTFLTPASVRYWSNQRNLATVSLRLPTRGQSLRTLIDYFLMIFIPSRSNKPIDEIRYVSKSVIKAVQVVDGTDIIYYTFQKINDKWLLHLDTLN